MFKSKPIGWITATTLLAVAGVALACRLKEGSGPASQADVVALAGDGDRTPPPPEATPPAPDKEVPPPAPEGVPPPPPTTGTLPPAPPPVDSPKAATLAPLPEPPKAEEKKPAGPIHVGEKDEPAPAKDVEKTKSPRMAESTLPPVPAKVEEQPKTPTAIEMPAPPLPGKVDSKAAEPVATIPPPPSPEKKFEETKPDSHFPVGGGPLPPPEAKTPVAPIDVKPLTAMPTAPSMPPKTYWTGKNETLREIARKTLGAGDRWNEIWKLNPDVRPDWVIPAGTMVRLPADAQVMPTPAGGKEESDAITPAGKTATSVKPLPVVRARPEDGHGGPTLVGTFQGKMDERHGLVLPREVCEQMGKCDTMLLTPGPDRCLWLVTQAGADRLLHRVEKAQIGDAEVQAFRRLYFSQTEKAAVDATNRLQVPDRLGDYAGLTGEIVLIGMDDHFELWDAARWHRYSQQKSASPKSSRDADE